MRILHRASKFTNNKQDLLVIYKSFVRSKLEQSASVWHSSLTKENKNDLELDLEFKNQLWKLF